VGTWLESTRSGSESVVAHWADSSERKLFRARSLRASRLPGDRYSSPPSPFGAKSGERCHQEHAERCPTGIHCFARRPRKKLESICLGVRRLRLIKPLKNLPIQVKTTDEAWIETVGKLISRASCTIVDLSATSPSIEVEGQLIAKSGVLDWSVVLADEQSMINAPPDDILRSAIAYSPSLLNSAVSTLAKAGSVLAVWLFNWASLWGWISLPRNSNSQSRVIRLQLQQREIPTWRRSI
jgi:hypothetical protein